MTESASTSLRATTAGRRRPSSSSGQTWFRTREGRRYGWELGLVIVVKLALLVALWLVFIQPWPRPAAEPATVVQRLYLPVAPAADP